MPVIRVMGPGDSFWIATLLYLSFVFFFVYLFVIADCTTLGFQEIPKLSSNLLDTEKSRFFKELVLLSSLLSLFFCV